MPRARTDVRRGTGAALLLLLALHVLCTSQAAAALRADDAAAREDVQVARGLSALRFVENRGQFGSEGLLDDARYLVWGSGVYAFLSPTSITYVFSRADVAQALISEASGAPLHGDTEVDRLLDRLRRTTLAHERLTVRFDGARSDAVLAAASAPTAHFNYYLTSAPEGITDVPAHDALVVRDLYPGIDLVYDVKSGVLKTSFVVHPGADPARIRMSYTGGATAIVDGALSSVTGLGFVTESAPVCFELDAPMRAAGGGFPDMDALRTAPAGGTHPASSYIMEDGLVGFSVARHDASRVLVIDPQILWGTYYGGSSSEVGNDVAMSPTGPIVAGMTTSTTGIATAGTYQTVFTGPSSDAFVAQFDAAGTLVWGTYFGGPSYEGAKSVARDASGLIGFTGFTASTSGVASAGAWQTAYAGGAQDAFVALFSASGGRIWSTYLGGGGYEDGNGIAFDSQGNVIVTGWTSSTSGIATPGTHQSVMAGGDDAFITTFSPAGARRWGTYLGGSGSDWGEGVAVDMNDNIVVVGRTNSASGIAVPMVQQPSYGGGPFYGDGYVAMFDGTGARTWASYIGGPGDDWATDVAMTSDNDIVVTGYTESATFIASRGVHQETLGGGEDAFVAQYAPWGVRRWGSYVGGTGQDRGRGVATVDSSYVMITGFTKSPNGIATPGAYQNGYNGGLEGDAFIVELTTTGVRVCGTYYGGPGSDVGIKIATDALGYMYATGYTESMTGMATTGSWKDVYGSMQDVFLGRFDLCLKSEVTSITIDAVAPGPYCAGDSLLIPFTVRGTFAAGNVFTAYLSDGAGGFSAPAFLGQLQGTTSGVIRCTIPIDVPTGTGYRVMIVSSSPYQQSPPNDRTITIYFKPIAEITPQQTVFLCPGRSITLRANTGAGLTYAWYSSESPNPIGTGSTLVVDRTASYVVRVTSPNGCSTLSLPTQVSVGLPPARAGDDRTICTGASTVLGDPLPGGQTFYRYSWTPTDGLNDPTIAKPTASPTRTTVYYLTQSDTSGCTGIDSVRVTVNPPIVFDLGADLTLCQGESLQLRPNITSGLGPYEIIWSPTTGLSSPKDLNPRAAPPVSTTYVLTLRDGAGCVGTDSVFIRVFPVTPPTVLAEGPTTFCKGDSVRLTAEAGYDAYSWSTGDTTRSAMVRVTGNHYVTVTDRNGCRVPSRTVFVHAIEPEIPKVTVWPSGTICAGDSAVLTVEGVHRAYRWSGGQRTRSIGNRARLDLRHARADAAYGGTAHRLPQLAPALHRRRRFARHAHVARGGRIGRRGSGHRGRDHRMGQRRQRTGHSLRALPHLLVREPRYAAHRDRHDLLADRTGLGSAHLLRRRQRRALARTEHPLRAVEHRRHDAHTRRAHKRTLLGHRHRRRRMHRPQRSRRHSRPARAARRDHGRHRALRGRPRRVHDRRASRHLPALGEHDRRDRGRQYRCARRDPLERGWPRHAASDRARRRDRMRVDEPPAAAHFRDHHAAHRGIAILTDLPRRRSRAARRACGTPLALVHRRHRRQHHRARRGQLHARGAQCRRMHCHGRTLHARRRRSADRRDHGTARHLHRCDLHLHDLRACGGCPALVRLRRHRALAHGRALPARRMVRQRKLPHRARGRTRTLPRARHPADDCQRPARAGGHALRHIHLLPG